MASPWPAPRCFAGVGARRIQKVRMGRPNFRPAASGAGPCGTPPAPASQSCSADSPVKWSLCGGRSRSPGVHGTALRRQNGSILPAPAGRPAAQKSVNRAFTSSSMWGARGGAPERHGRPGSGAALTQQCILLGRQSGQLLGMGGDGGHFIIGLSSPQGSDLLVQRAQGLQNILDQFRFPPGA